MDKQIHTTPHRDRLMRISDVAELLNISNSMVYKIVHAGELPVVRINTSIRIRKQDLDEYVQRSWTGQQAE